MGPRTGGNIDTKTYRPGPQKAGPLFLGTPGYRSGVLAAGPVPLTLVPGVMRRLKEPKPKSPKVNS